MADLIPPGNDDRDVRARQKGRALVMALALGAFVILMFAITIAKMSVKG